MSSSTATARWSGPAPWDEAYVAPGVPRPSYAPLLEALERAGPARVVQRVVEETARRDVTFGAGVDADPYRLDAVPRLIAAGEWAALAAALEQRVRALNAFVTDAYGARRIVDAGVVPARVVDDAEGYEPELRGRLPDATAPIAVAGLDVVRDETGTLRVLEDNCRAPSGFCYVVAGRDALEAALPGDVPDHVEVAAATKALICGVLDDAAPAGVGEPHAVVLSDGPHNAAAWEHARVAALTGAQLVTLGDLRVRGDRLVAARPGGGWRTVDVLYRRCDEDRVRDDAGRLTALAELTLGPWLAGRLGLVNALGSGVADDKLVHAYVEDMVRFYLGEEPALASVTTLDLGVPETLREVLADLERHVVKPRGGFGGHGVVVCGHARADTLAALREMLARDPGGYVAQRTVSLSTHPTVVDGGRLRARHVDLRPFVFTGRGRPQTLPGGLTRVALQEGALVVNSSQDGGCKDTWILR